MASTFKRRSKPSVASALGSSSDADAQASQTIGNSSNSSSSMLGLRGTKPWTGGTTLTSSGLRDLDGILGGGQPLGTCLLVEEDRWTQSLALSFVRYWCAEVSKLKQCGMAYIKCFVSVGCHLSFDSS